MFLKFISNISTLIILFSCTEKNTSFQWVETLPKPWELSEDKTQLITSYSFLTLNYVDTSTIIKLKINDLGLMGANGDKTYYEYK